MEIDRHELLQMLQLSSVQLLKLTKNRHFAQPVRESKFRTFYDLDDIRDWASKFDWARQQGWKVPDAFFAWEFDAPMLGIIVRRKAA
jgi:hypothetical protein